MENEMSDNWKMHHEGIEHRSSMYKARYNMKVNWNKYAFNENRTKALKHVQGAQVSNWKMEICNSQESNRSKASQQARFKTLRFINEVASHLINPRPCVERSRNVGQWICQAGSTQVHTSHKP